MREAGPQVRFAIPPSSKVRAAALPSYSAGLSRRPSRRRLLSAYAPLGPRLRGDIRLGRARPALSSPGSLCRAGPTYSSPSTPVSRYDSMWRRRQDNERTLLKATIQHAATRGGSREALRSDVGDVDEADAGVGESLGEQTAPVDEPSREGTVVDLVYPATGTA